METFTTYDPLGLLALDWSGRRTEDGCEAQMIPQVDSPSQAEPPGEILGETTPVGNKDYFCPRLSSQGHRHRLAASGYCVLGPPGTAWSYLEVRARARARLLPISPVCEQRHGSCVSVTQGADPCSATPLPLCQVSPTVVAIVLALLSHVPWLLLSSDPILTLAETAFRLASQASGHLTGLTFAVPVRMHPVSLVTLPGHLKHSLSPSRVSYSARIGCRQSGLAWIEGLQSITGGDMIQHTCPGVILLLPFLLPFSPLCEPQPTTWGS